MLAGGIRDAELTEALTTVFRGRLVCQLSRMLNSPLLSSCLPPEVVLLMLAVCKRSKMTLNLARRSLAMLKASYTKVKFELTEMQRSHDEMERRYKEMNAFYQKARG